ncbi:MAG: hypothetical protein RXO36_08325 [Candidatus Nanopusillus acidilobi]
MSQVQVEVQENKDLSPDEAFFKEYLRSHKDLAQKVVGDLIDNIRLAVLSRHNINDGEKSAFLVSLGEVSEVFRLLKTAVEVAEYTEDHTNTKKLNEAFIGFIRYLIKTYYDIKEDREPFNEIWRDVYYLLNMSYNEFLGEFIKDLGDKISVLKNKQKS